MFGALVEEIRLETVKKDTTNALPAIMDRGRKIVTHMQHSGHYTKSQLRKLGLVPKWKRNPKAGDGN